MGGTARSEWGEIADSIPAATAIMIDRRPQEKCAAEIPTYCALHGRDSRGSLTARVPDSVRSEPSLPPMGRFVVARPSFRMPQRCPTRDSDRPPFAGRPDDSLLAPQYSRQGSPRAHRKARFAK